MEELVHIALVGTSKAAEADAADAEHPSDALVAQLGADDREHALLLGAGARAVFEQCGRVAVQGVTPPEPCPGESCPVAGRLLAGLLQNAMNPESRELLADFLAQLHAAGLVLPPELLPEALGLGDAKLRERLLPVLGQRGRWLSRFNPDWGWATTSVAQLSARDHEALRVAWDEGTFPERCRVLETLRRSVPAEGRKLLEAAIDKEKPDHRVRFLEALEIGLGPEDEPLLESRLDDRAEQVRRAAAALLARLPGSALAGRMRERADAMLNMDASAQRLGCTPPEEIDKAWTRDGVPAKPPSGRGKRALWTEAVLSAIPPSHWSQRFAAEPAQLIAAALEDDFAQAILAGWTLAAAAFARDDHPSAAWLRPLWDHWVQLSRKKGDRGQAEAIDHARALLTAMSGPDAEDAMTALLTRAAASDDLIAVSFLQFVPPPWSANFAGACLATARKVLKSRADNVASAWANVLLVAGRAIAPETFAEALQPWETAESEKAGWYCQAIRREVEQFDSLVRLRQNFHEELSRAVALAGRPAT